jgi:hypothetical protein
MISIAIAVLAGLCLWTILSPQIHTGVLPTTGLFLVLCACGASLDDSAYIYRAFVVMVYGCLLIGIGVLWRQFGAPWFARFQFAKVLEAESRAWQKRQERRHGP